MLRGTDSLPVPAVWQLRQSVSYPGKTVWLHQRVIGSFLDYAASVHRDAVNHCIHGDFAV